MPGHVHQGDQTDTAARHIVVVAADDLKIYVTFVLTCLLPQETMYAHWAA